MHHVSSCDQCGHHWCDANIITDRPNITCDYEEGASLSNIGCDKIPLVPTVVRDSASHKIYLALP